MKIKLQVLLLLVLVLFFSCETQTKIPVGSIQIPDGELLVYLFEDTPKHRAAFIELAQEGYWNDYTFNRVIDNFVAQGGCPDTPEGFAYSVHLLEPEFEPEHKHVYGAFGAGRDNNPGKLSAACQFYIVQNRNGLSRLDGNYQIYGHVFKGMELIDELVKAPTDSLDQSLKDVPLQVSIVEMTLSEIKALGFDPNEKLSY